MQAGPPELAQVRLDNAMALFEEFVRLTARHADAATLRGLERRFAERVQIQPSYWSQIKSRSRQIGERLARQFEHLCHKPRGWMDLAHSAEAASAAVATREAEGQDETAPQDDDARLLDLLGEVLTPQAAAVLPRGAGSGAAPGKAGRGGAGAAASAGAPRAADDSGALWQRTQAGVAALKRKR